MRVYGIMKEIAGCGEMNRIAYEKESKMLKCFKNDSFFVYYSEDWENTTRKMDEEDLFSLDAPDRHGYLVFFKDTLEKTPEEQAEEALQGFLDEYEDAEFVDIEETVAGHVLKGFDVDFFYLDFPCMASIRAIQYRDSVYLVVAKRHISENTFIEADFQQIIYMWAENLDKVGKAAE